MGSAGADASAGTHDLSGCLDVRTWNLTEEQRHQAMRKARQIGWAAWYRTEAQGFDPHMHWLLLAERPMHPDAANQEAQYLAGLNGLASRGPDDFWRPDPIRRFDYAAYLEEDMGLTEAQAKKLNEIHRLVTRAVPASRKRDLEMAAALREARAEIEALGDVVASGSDVKTVTAAVREQAKKSRDKLERIAERLESGEDEDRDDEPS